MPDRSWLPLLVIAAGIARGQSAPDETGSYAEVCDLKTVRKGEGLIRAVGRISGNGLILGDRTCGVSTQRGDVPWTIVVKKPRFARREDRETFLEAAESLDRALVQVLIRGRYECGAIEAGRLRGGFGKTATIACRIDSAIVLRLHLFHPMPPLSF